MFANAALNAHVFDRVLSLAIRLAATTVILGWLLSALGILNVYGYLCLGLPAILLVIFLTRRADAPKTVSLFHRVVRWWKGRRVLPLIFLFVFALIVAGSLLHVPNNYDALAYRIPRVLHWTRHHHWYWINTPFGQLNYTLPNYAWLTVPLFLTTGGFAMDVVINWVAFLFLPPLFFSLLRAFGTPRRLAWNWMWIFPSGYMIAMQAGGLGNDLLGLTAILAALYCANRYIASGRKSCLFDALLAAGFCTGVKLSCLPLAMFVLIVLLKKPDWLRARWRTLAAGTAAGICVSAFIPLLLNLEHTGTILGIKGSVDKLHSPVAGLVGNGLISLGAALEPPVFPSANHISALAQRALGAGLNSWLHARYPKFSLRLNELPQEENGALGLGITVALLMSIILWMRFGKRKGMAAPQPSLLRWQRVAWWVWFAVAWGIVSANLGTGVGFPRDMLSWYPLALAPLVAGFACEPIGRSTVWKVLAPLVSLSVVPGLLLTPSRPLVPPPVLARLAQKCGASTAMLQRLNRVYTVYADRADVFAGLKKYLPPSVQTLALVSTGDEPTASWWKPYGSRRCIYLLSPADVQAARNEGVAYIVVNQKACRKYFHMDVPQWLATYHARAIKRAEVRLLASQPPFAYTLARFDPP